MADTLRGETKRGAGMSDLLLALGVACFVDQTHKHNGEPHDAAGKASEGPRASDASAPQCPPPQASPCESLVIEPRAPAAAPEFHPLLLSERDSLAKIRWTSTLASSAMLHGAMLAGFAATTTATYPPVVMPKYHIEILHLQQPSEGSNHQIRWVSLRNPVTTSAAARNGQKQQPELARGRKAKRNHGRAPQTLVVDAAPPDLHLDKPMPLPLEITRSLRLLPPNAIEVKVQEEAESDKNTLSLPAVRMTSLPSAEEQAAAAAMIPKVNQSAEGGTTSAANGTAANTQGGNVSSDSLAALAAVRKENANVSGVSGRVDADSGYATAVPEEARAIPVPQTAGGYDWSAIPGVANTREYDAAGHSTSVPQNVTRIDVPGSKPRMQILAESSHLPGRFVATFYLNMGLPKSWGLEYWVNGDSLSGVSAPWPYTMYRPEFSFPANTDTLLIRARLAEDGCLENPEFVASAAPMERDLVLQALQSWRMRPAMRQGRPIAVEILLVIPRQDGN